MTDMSVSSAPVVVEAYDFSGFKTLADIAGGHGYLLAQILKANPGLKGVLFDVPSVIEGAGALLEKAGVAARVETVTGDFFAAVPPGADAYIMKHIIHDWDDERAIKILQSIHAAMPAAGGGRKIRSSPSGVIAAVIMPAGMFKSGETGVNR